MGLPRATARGVTFLRGQMTRICVYVDGFNLYHAIDNLRVPKLKWLDLNKLMHNFIDPNVHTIVSIYYFSAYATWRETSYEKHTKYVEALTNFGVQPVMGKFKNKTRFCKLCKTTSLYHEEKETDVNIAISLVNDAYENIYDEAFVVSQDSDLFPAIRLVRQKFPHKQIKIITPPNMRHSKEMANAVGKKKLASILPLHIERSQLPDEIVTANGKIITRPCDWK